MIGKAIIVRSADVSLARTLTLPAENKRKVKQYLYSELWGQLLHWLHMSVRFMVRVASALNRLGAGEIDTHRMETRNGSNLSLRLTGLR